MNLLQNILLMMKYLKHFFYYSQRYSKCYFSTTLTLILFSISLNYSQGQSCANATTVNLGSSSTALGESTIGNYYQFTPTFDGFLTYCRASFGNGVSTTVGLSKDCINGNSTNEIEVELEGKGFCDGGDGVCTYLSRGESIYIFVALNGILGSPQVNFRFRENVNSFDCSAPSNDNPCTVTPTNISCGSTVNGDTRNGTSTFDGDTYSGCRNYASSNFSRNDHIYQVNETINEQVTITLNSSVDLDLFVYDCIELGCFNVSDGGTGNEVITLGSITPNVKIIVDGDVQEGAYTLSISCGNPVEICGNGQDDDGDGRIDCADSDCARPNITNVVPTPPNNCPNLNNGRIVINATGSSLRYSINNGASFQTSSTFSNLPPGTYRIVVRNNSTGCEDTDTVILPESNCCEDEINDDCQIITYTNNGPSNTSNAVFSYTFSVPNTQPNGRWTAFNGTSTISIGSGRTTTRTLFNQSYQICYVYDKDDGCEVLCCIDLCVEAPETGEQFIDVEYVQGESSGYRFKLQGAAQQAADPSTICWYRDSGGEVNASIGTNQQASDIVSFPTTCRTETICCKFYDTVSNCWKYYCRDIYICDPFDCGLIPQPTQNANGNFVFNLSNNNISELEWFFNGAENSFGDGQGAVLPPPNQNCEDILVCAKYLDNFTLSYRMCCVRLNLCGCDEPTDRFDCDELVFEGNTNGTYRFRTTLPDPAQLGLEWSVNGNQVNNPNTSYDFTPSGIGENTICIDYTLGECKERCCIKICVEDEEAQGREKIEVTYAPIENGNFFLTLDANQPATTNSIMWFQENIEGSPTMLQTGTRNINIRAQVESNNCIRTYCCKFFDPSSGCWRYYCVQVNICSPENCGDIPPPVFNVAKDSFEFTLPNGAQAAEFFFNSSESSMTPIAHNTTFAPVFNNGFCEDLEICIRYIDPTSGCVTYCCFEVDLCNCIPSIPDPAIAADPEDGCIQFSTTNGTNYSFNAFNFDDSGILTPVGFTWTIDGNVQSGWQGIEMNAVLSPNESGTEICWERTGPDGCPEKCCIEICVAEPEDKGEQFIDYNQSGDSFLFQLTDPTADPSTVCWYTIEEGSQQPQFFNEGTPPTGLTYSVPISSPCRILTICCKFYDTVSNCWRYYCRKVYVCDPFECQEDIAYAYSINRYEFTLNNPNVLAGSMSWFRDGNIPIPNRLLVPDVDCRRYQICVKYYDTQLGSWRICCIDAELCDPFSCEDIVIDYDGPVDQYVLSIDDPNASSIQWRDDNAQMDLGTGLNQFIPIDENNCNQRNAYSVRYRVNGEGGGYWRYCCVNLCRCRPQEACEISIRYDPTDLEFEFTLEDNNAEDLVWAFATEPRDRTSSIGRTHNVPRIVQEGNPECERTLCVRYFDPITQCYRVCCVKVDLCDPTGCNDILDPVFNSTTNEFDLTLLNGNATDIAWYQGDDIDPFSENSANVSLPPSPPANCEQVTICVRYRDQITGCYEICCREVDLCEDDCAGEDPLVFTAIGENGNTDCTIYRKEGDTYFFTAQPMATITTRLYQWSVDGTVIDPVGSTFFSQSLPEGEHEICWEVTTSEGCVERCCITLCVEPEEVPEPNWLNFNLVNNGYQFNLIESINANGICWYIQGTPLEGNTQTNIAIGTGRQSDIVPIPNNCEVITVCCKYYDIDSECWRYYCREIYLCDPFDCGVDIAYNYDVQSEQFEFTLNGNFDANQPVFWTLDGNNIGTGESISQRIPDCRNYVVCVEYYDPTLGCWRRCCITVELCNPLDCQDVISCQYDAPNKAYRLSLIESLGSSATNISWQNDNTNEQFATSVIDVPVPTGDCVTNTFSVKYFDSTCECWRICCITIYLCDPDACEDVIVYDYNRQNNTYDFSLNQGNITNISWSNNITGLTENGSIYRVPTPTSCETYTVCVKYFDMTARRWESCCIDVFICDPVDCDDVIIYDYELGDNRYKFDLDNAINARAGTISWKNDSTGDDLGMGNTAFVAVPDDCETYTISVTYFDEDCLCWRVCCITIEICNPFDCDVIISTRDNNQNGYSFTLNDNPEGVTTWQIDETGEILGTGTEIFVEDRPSECREITISVIYFDPDCQCWKFCCLSIILCDPEGGTEICGDGIDNNGDGTIDENCPTCNDGIQNGNETGVDCGGPDCSACPPAVEICGDGIDNNGDGTIDENCPTCNDGIQNGNETGVDCGGPDCNACPPAVEICGDGIDNNGDGTIDENCPTCNDGIQNGNETGVDCGGPDCNACTPAVEICGDGIDNNGDGTIDENCPTCNDEIQNGNETGVDCGGPDCNACPPDIEICNDGIDNDGDGLIDCRDPDCPSCETEICDNGIDDDGDGLVDCQDPDCNGTSTCLMEICDNGIDDDGDGLIDCRDPSCPDCDPDPSCTSGPIASFNYSVVGITQIAFTDASSQNPSAWTWDFGDNSTADQQHPIHEYTNEGSYNVCLTASNDCGTSLQSCQDITIVENDSSGIIIDIGEIEGGSGDTLLLPVSVVRCSGCDSITAFEGYFQFDTPSLVNILSVEEGVFTYDDLRVVNDNPTNMVIGYSGTDNLSLSMGDTLFYIRLLVMGEAGESTGISFGENREGNTSFLGGFIDGRRVLFDLTSFTNGQLTIIESSLLYTGNFKTVKDEPINNVLSTIYDDQTALSSFRTRQDGKYTYQINQRFTDVRLEAFKDTLHLEGLSVNSTQKGYEYLAYLGFQIDEVSLTPYQIIALDMDCDGRISFQDINFIETILLGASDDFEGCPSWTFLREDHEFENPLAPFRNLALDEVVLSREDVQNGVDILGIKRGDLGYEADPSRSSNSLHLEGQLPNESKKGGIIELPLKVKSFNDKQAFQGALHFDTDKLSFVGMTNNQLPYFDESNYSVNQGNLRLVWTNPTTKGISFANGDTLVTLQFKVKQPILDWQRVISFDQRTLQPMAISDEFLVQPFNIDFTQALPKDIDLPYKLYQNTPNPFGQKTAIRFQLPRKMPAILTIYNSLGQVVKRFEQTFEQGDNLIELDKTDFHAIHQLLYYNLQTEGFVDTKAMILLK